MEKSERVTQRREFLSLKSDVDWGMSDLAAGRVTDFDVDRIIEQGKRHRMRSSISTMK
jgi:antitoxin ParD1/3/4